MSAFIVNDKHIDALITWASRPQWSTPSTYYHNNKRRTFFENQDLIGQILVNQNFVSVNNRYDRNTTASEYKCKRYPKPLSPIEIISACDFYNYQACETGDYWESEAHSIVDTIRERAIAELPGMDVATWEIR